VGEWEKDLGPLVAIVVDIDRGLVWVLLIVSSVWCHSTIVKLDFDFSGDAGLDPEANLGDSSEVQESVVVRVVVVTATTIQSLGGYVSEFLSITIKSKFPLTSRTGPSDAPVVTDTTR